MAICEITGKGKMYGHNVSFSQRHTRKVFKPNVNQTRVTNKDIEDSIKAFYALPEKVSGTDADNYFKTFNSANIDPISAYVLQINSTIVPLN